MKKLVIALSFIFLFFSCKKSESENLVTNQYKRYDVESGMIEYKTTINGEVMGSTVSGEGTSSLYFKDWGAIELTEETSKETTEINFLGQKEKDITNDHAITKIENGMVYTVDFENKKINKIENISMELMKGTDVNKIGKQMLETMGGKELENEKFKGYDCEVWDLNGNKQYFYKGIQLKSEIEMMGMTTITEATSVKFNTKISDDKFKLPDYEVVAVDTMMGEENMEDLINSDAYSDDMQEVNENMDALSEMSFKEWKKMAQSNDPEMAEMSDKELRQTYDMMQQIIKLRMGK